ncbi:MAG TPA: MOSC domain-containing protein, partial [Casimicrobiaceae bacterium]|nr:MOSC domain-containing protein [Casimicrobiaceae bacterium]
MTASIAALFVYPVKGCRGIALSSALVTERGLEHDREWMVVDIAGRFVTQRTEPRLASITTAITATSLILAMAG